ncbi:MAG: GTP cyclohydrolase FolE2 [Gammaproteobacteria bacterium]|nr:GTP cyclohydrolase FolE2 [Gammaproteobacteria bacterium]
MLVKTLPDVAADGQPDAPARLQWVGMEQIAVPTFLNLSTQGTLSLAASVNVYVSLDSLAAKGIHMSRLHHAVNTLNELECSKSNIDKVLDVLIESQGDISNSARLELDFDLILKKSALLSDESGFQAYPVKIAAEKKANRFNYQIEVVIPYSSTCPCSASLSRQLYANAVDGLFKGNQIDKKELLAWIQSDAGSIATPHSQRSYATVRYSFTEGDWQSLDSFIFNLEKAIGTPVQTAVKRIDEQEFARLNAENLMFCEDAARRIKAFLQQLPELTDYWFKVDHQESLHGHNAVVIDFKESQNSA